MSNETKNKFKILASWIFNEIHKGNMLVIIGMIALWFFFVVPTYEYVHARIEGSRYVEEYIIGDVDKLKQEITELKKQSSRDLDNRKTGKVGYSYH